jgi:glycosyltransferase involved in cell wall biosynthesis
MTRATPRFSIVIPVFNEAESIDELLSSIEATMARLDASFEVIVVDDGSTDATLDRLQALARTRGWIRIASFRRNLGKAPALTCGFGMAAGEYVITMDGDLQDDPANLPAMFESLIADRMDVVSGWRRDRRDGWLKIFSSRIFNALIVRLLFRFHFNDMNSGLKLYRAEVVKELRLYGGMHRFIPLIAREMGYRVAEVPITHHERRHGVSKYRSTKILTEIPDLLTIFFLTKYTRRPLHFFGRIGSVLGLIGFISLSYLTILWFQGISIGTRPLLLFGVLLVLIGGQTVFTGLLADLIVNVNQDTRQAFPLKYVSDHTYSTQRAAEQTRSA